MTVLLLMISVAIPNYVGMMRDVRASQAVADLQAVRAAAYLYYGDHQTWPPEEQAGVVPDALRSYLSKNIAFVNPAYQIDWENWIIADEPHPKSKEKVKLRSKYPETGVMVGISIRTDDARLIKAARSLLVSTRTWTASDRQTTIVIAGEDGF